MSNYIVSYDLNGSTPTHAAMDQHIATMTHWTHGRVLETVWYVGTSDTQAAVYAHFNKILSTNDRLLVVTCLSANWRNLLVKDSDLKSAWDAH